jgi:cytochrome P450
MTTATPTTVEPRPSRARQAALTAGIVAFVASERLRRRPYGLYGWCRRLDPIHASAFGVFVVTSHSAVHAGLRHPALGSDETRADNDALRIGPLVRLLGRDRRGEADGAAFRALARKLLVFIDAPDHTRLRRLVSKAFSPRVAEGLAPRAAEIVDDLLAPLRFAGRFELMHDLAYPLPALIICELLGVPADDAPVIIRAAPALAGAFDPQPIRTPAMVERADLAVLRLQDFLDGLIERRRRDPGTDLLSALVRVEDDGDRLSHDELVAVAILLLMAGHETTAHLIGNGLHALLRNPAALARLRADDGLDRTAVDELLRHSGPVQIVQRVALEDLELEGHRIPAGRIVVLSLAAANRDPAVFERPDDLVLDRDPNPHVAFGGGAHHCLGAALARMEARVALTALVREFPDLRAGRRPGWWPSFTLRGLEAFELAAGEARTPVARV